MQNLIRRKNLSLLAFECGAEAALGQRLGIEYTKMRGYFRNKLSEISDAFARDIEVKMNKPKGWMDRLNYDLALSADEWQLLMAYRAGTQRDKMYLNEMSKLICS